VSLTYARVTVSIWHVQVSVSRQIHHLYKCVHWLRFYSTG
jgi:hypothetical protein